MLHNNLRLRNNAAVGVLATSLMGASFLSAGCDDRSAPAPTGSSVRATSGPGGGIPGLRPQSTEETTSQSGPSNPTDRSSAGADRDKSWSPEHAQTEDQYPADPNGLSETELVRYIEQMKTDLGRRNDELQAYIQSRKAQVDSLRGEKAQLWRTDNLLTSSFEELNAKAAKVLVERTTEVSQLKDQVEATKKESNELQTNVDAMQAQVKQLRIKTAELREKLAALQPKAEPLGKWGDYQEGLERWLEAVIKYITTKDTPSPGLPPERPTVKLSAALESGGQLPSIYGVLAGAVFAVNSPDEQETESQLEMTRREYLSLHQELNGFNEKRESAAADLEAEIDRTIELIQMHQGILARDGETREELLVRVSDASAAVEIRVKDQTAQLGVIQKRLVELKTEAKRVEEELRQAQAEHDTQETSVKAAEDLIKNAPAKLQESGNRLLNIRSEILTSISPPPSRGGAVGRKYQPIVRSLPHEIADALSNLKYPAPER